MAFDRQSSIFNYILMFWKIFGLWPTRKAQKYYKYYSIFYLAITLLIYNILLTVSLFYAPRQIDVLIREAIFYFAEITVTAKMLMIFSMRQKILDNLEILDSETFAAETRDEKKVIRSAMSSCSMIYKIYAFVCHIAYIFQFFVPIVLHPFFGNKVDLPISHYYFLTDLQRNNYFWFWYGYQALVLYGHMMNNINVDCYIAFVLILGRTQFNVLKSKFLNISNITILVDNRKLTHNSEKSRSMMLLKKYLGHYELLLQYCNQLQEILSVSMFVQFRATSIVLCIILCGFHLATRIETYVFLTTYFFAVSLEIFLPCLLGSMIIEESQELVRAAYNCDWISQSKIFKSSLLLFITRCNTPVKLTGLKIFTLSLRTFTSIMKTTYSFFTLLRNVQTQ